MAGAIIVRKQLLGVAAKVIVEELAEDAALGCLVGHALPAGGIGVFLLLLEALEGGHEAGAPAAGAGGVCVLVLAGLAHGDGWRAEDGGWVCLEMDSSSW